MRCLHSLTRFVCLAWLIVIVALFVPCLPVQPRQVHAVPGSSRLPALDVERLLDASRTREGDHTRSQRTGSSAGQLEIQSASQFQGWHDSADCSWISGWAWDSGNPNNPVNLDIYDGNTLIAIVTANQFRADLYNFG